jgi:hypothetical protein
MFSLRDTGYSTMSFKEEWHNPLVPIPGTTTIKSSRVLDLTVTNRSNDLIWGLLGANYVCFSILQEYMAARLGVGVGHYHHFTNNLHLYCDRGDWQPTELLADRQQDWYAVGAIRERGSTTNTFPLIRDSQLFEQELSLIVDHFDGMIKEADPRIDEVSEPFLKCVAGPMLRAYELHRLYKESETALRMCDLIEADDWKIACRNWLQRRLDRRARHAKDR